MLYRCLKCEHETAGGCLPTASCGLYFVGLLILPPLVMLGVLGLVRWLVPTPAPPEDAGEPATPWWLLPASCLAAPVLMFGGAWAFDYVLRCIERFRMWWVKCPDCGARTWSKGYTSGFGL